MSIFDLDFGFNKKGNPREAVGSRFLSMAEKDFMMRMREGIAYHENESTRYRLLAQEQSGRYKNLTGQFLLNQRGFYFSDWNDLDMNLSYQVQTLFFDITQMTNDDISENDLENLYILNCASPMLESGRFVDTAEEITGMTNTMVDFAGALSVEDAMTRFTDSARLSGKMMQLAEKRMYRHNLISTHRRQIT